MPSLVISEIQKGMNQRYPPFLLNNQTFETLTNVFPYRASLLKKTAPLLIGFLTQNWTNISLGTWSGNISTSISALTPVTLPSGFSVVPGSVTISIAGPPYTITDNGSGGFVNGVTPIAGTINYNTGVINGVDPGGAPDGSAVTISFKVEPHYPVMGIEPYEQEGDNSFPIQLYFDQKWCYLWNQSDSFIFNSYYKSPTQPGRIVEWTGADYQQFQSLTYSGAIFVTNGIAGFHMLSLTGISQANPAVVTTSTSHGIPVGQTVLVWFNDLSGAGLGASWTANVNQKTFTATSTGANTLTIPLDTTGAGYTNPPTSGIMQLLTATLSGDGIRWYDNQNRAGTTNDRGFVNFAPPLDSGANPRYLVGCDGLFTYKDHLMVWGTYERRIGDPSATYYPYRIAWCQLGNPYYANVAVPSQFNSGAPATDGDPSSWIQFPGRGGNIPINNQENILNCISNEDEVLIQCQNSSRKLYYNNNEFDPFQIQGINWEYGADTPFAAIKIEQLVMTMSQKAITATSSTDLVRLDEAIPDQIYRLSTISNGVKRVSAIRDYRNEIIMFAYPDIEDTNTVFPTRMVVYNYIDKVFAIFIENVTTAGTFQRSSGFTWDNVPYESWDEWDTTWDYFQDNEKYPFTSFGTPQGSVFFYARATAPDAIFYATTFSLSNNIAVIESPNHPFNVNTTISFSTMPGLNIPDDAVYAVIGVDGDEFSISVPEEKMITGTYVGGGTFSRMDNFFFRTAQFNPFQETGQSVNLTSTRVLVDKTDFGAFTLDLITDFNAAASNDGVQTPFMLKGRTVSTSRSGNTIFQQAAASQIWQRMITPGSGMTVQIRGRLSLTQMLDKAVCTSPFRLYTILVNIDPGRASC